MERGDREPRSRPPSRAEPLDRRSRRRSRDGGGAPLPVDDRRRLLPRDPRGRRWSASASSRIGRLAPRRQVDRRRADRRRPVLRLVLPPARRRHARRTPPARRRRPARRRPPACCSSSPRPSPTSRPCSRTRRLVPTLSGSRPTTSGFPGRPRNLRRPRPADRWQSRLRLDSSAKFARAFPRRRSTASSAAGRSDQAELGDGGALVGELGGGGVDPAAGEVVDLQALDDLPVAVLVVTGKEEIRPSGTP